MNIIYHLFDFSRKRDRRKYPVALFQDQIVLWRSSGHYLLRRREMEMGEIVRNWIAVEGS